MTLTILFFWMVAVAGPRGRPENFKKIGPIVGGGRKWALIKFLNSHLLIINFTGGTSLRSCAAMKRVVHR